MALVVVITNCKLVNFLLVSCGCFIYQSLTLRIIIWALLIISKLVEISFSQSLSFLLSSLFKLVESTFLWKLHDLYNNEAKASDNIHLVPSGMETLISVKRQQYAMHCDAITEEIKPVMILITIPQNSWDILVV